MLNVYILTEAGKNIGFGHLMRMIAIYQAFEIKNIKPKFIINGDESVEEYLKETEYEIFNWIDNQKRLFDMIKDADIAIIDSYLADLTFYEKISKLVNLPVYYDDNNRIEYPSGVVVNGNIHAKDLDYPKRDDINYLLGLEYLPLRKEFWEVPEKKIKENVESIMITFGGDDFRNMTPKVLKLLAENYPNIKKNVIIGKGFKNIKEIEKASDENTALIYFPDAQKMKEVMLESDIAISAGGQTLYELAKVGVPTIAVIVADNQYLAAKKMFNMEMILSVFMYPELRNTFGKLVEDINLPIDKRKFSKNKMGILKKIYPPRVVNELLKLFHILS